MKGFKRHDFQFSLCGLNCALCTMKLGNLCPGCGGGEGNQGCTIARCSLQFENLDYCFQCKNYPCPKYEGIEQYDSFITHRHQLADMRRMQEMGAEQYHAELKQKLEILTYLLDNFNDGRRKTFFSLAVNLLNINDIIPIVEDLKTKIQSAELTLKEKSAMAVNMFSSIADKRNIILKLNKKDSKNKS